MTSNEIKKGTLELLRLAFRVAEPWRVGSHMGKVTALELMARVGAQVSIRKFLGYHMDAANVTMATYARENCAEPLRQLEKMLLLVRLRLFDPDTSRSGMFNPGLLHVGFDAWTPTAGMTPKRTLLEDCHWFQVINGKSEVGVTGRRGSGWLCHAGRRTYIGSRHCTNRIARRGHRHGLLWRRR
jgi:hypothetical protein